MDTSSDLRGANASATYLAEFKVAEPSFEQAEVSARKMAEKMIDYGMGQKAIIPYASDRYKEMIDKEVEDLIAIAYQRTRILLLNSETFVISEI
jgi:hypothetical protein